MTPDSLSIDELRQNEFPNLNHIHLANCSQGARTRRATEGINRYMNSWQEKGMDWEYWMEEVNRAKGDFSRLIGAEENSVAISFSVSSLLGTIASSFDYEGRKKIVTTGLDFPTVPQIWRGHERLGARVEVVPAKEDDTIDFNSYEEYIDGDTLLVSVPFVSYKNGYKQNISRLAEIAHDNGALILIDAYQGIGTEPIDVQEMDIDFLVTGTLKYLLGIPGVAFGYSSPEIIQRLTPSATGWQGQADPFEFDLSLEYAEGGRRLETGTPPVIATFASRAAMELLMDVGIGKIKSRIDTLSQHCIKEAKSRGLQLKSDFPTKHKGPITAIEVPDPHSVENSLKERGIVCSARGEVIRLAHHFFNTREELTKALDSICEVIR